MQKYFVVEKFNTISAAEKMCLNHLYQPFIGVEAVALYNLLIDYIEINKNYNIYFSFDELLPILSVDQIQLDKIQKRLEATGLISVFEKADNKHFVIKINKPLEPIRFRSNTFLYKLFLRKSDEQAFERIASVTKSRKYDKTEFLEVTTKFQDVFNLKEIDSQANTLELKVRDFKSKEEALRGLVPLHFYNYLTGETASPTLIKTISEIQQYGFVNSSINKILDYSFSVNGQVVSNHIIKIAKDFHFKEIKTFDEIDKDLDNALKNKGINTGEINIIDAIETNDQSDSKDWKSAFDDLGDL